MKRSLTITILAVLMFAVPLAAQAGAVKVE
jgi:hypothetical protein